MNLENLREHRRRERQQDSLQPLPESFYGDVAEYLRELKTAREEAAEQATDPYGDPEVRRLTDELQTAESVVESLYERRVGKVVKHASFAAADMPHERDGLTEEERALFDDLVARIKQNRGRVLDTLAGEGEGKSKSESESEATNETEPPADEPPRTPGESTAKSGRAPPDRDDPAGMLADAMGVDGERRSGETAAPEPPTDRPGPSADSADDGGTEEAPPTPPAVPDEAASRPTSPDQSRPSGDDSDAPDSNERTTVRITADVGEIYGVDDRSYSLEAEDVVDLPADNAAPLIEKEAAKRLS